ncbi:MAG: endonuclease NucS domain-containing protein [Candidatus Hermodarchaeota archaeon]
MSSDLHYILFHSKDTDTKKLTNILDMLKAISETKNIPFTVRDVSKWKDSQKGELLRLIRDISGRKKIAVKSHGGGALPISRTGLLNLKNIPILLVYEADKALWVFPHAAQKVRREIEDYLQLVLDSKNPENLAFDVFSEEDIIRILKNYPYFIESGLQFVDEEVPIEGGRIDAVFLDSQDRHFLIEVEIVAQDNAVGQVSRFVEPYANKFNVPLDQIRMGIVCLEISNSVQNACKVANIEVFRLSVVRVV